jgi:hypothetical protein
VRRFVLLGIAAALLASAAAPPAAGARPTAVGVGEREWRVALYRSTVPVGFVRFNVRNFGEDGHDLAVRNRRGRVRGQMPEIRPGTRGSLTVRLRRPGRFVVFCSLAGHEELGMRAELRAKKRRR